MEVVKVREEFAREREAEITMEAYQTYGERIILRLSWNLSDFKRGLVDRCSDCHAGDTADVRQRMAEVYKQAGDSRCPSCFGIGFEGGFKPTIYLTYMLAEGDAFQVVHEATGEMERRQPPIYLPWTPKVTNGDLAVRVEEWDEDDETPLVEQDRYICQTVSSVKLRTGPGLPGSEVYVGQSCTIQNVPKDHPYQNVPVTSA